MDDTQSALLDIHLREFDKIKTEQLARIAFRDNLMYATLVSYGAVVSFAAKDNPMALLILPWVSLILGWSYLVNDEKVSAIGRYVRLTLPSQISRLLDGVDFSELFGWEIAHRSDSRRRRRKLQQLVVDQVIFVLSGFSALIAFWMSQAAPGWILGSLIFIEGALLVVLGVEIILYADIKSGR